MRQKRVTIEDVAKAAGVSITTVSRFLNQRYDSMSATTRDRIAKIVADLNYQPNALAQGLKGNSTKTIAVVVVNISYPFCVAVIRSLSEVLSQSEYRLVTADTEGDPERERNLLQSLMAQQVEGIVIQTNGDNNDLIEQYAARIPIVIVDRQIDIPHTLNVVTNNEEASFQLTKSLFTAGYRQVIYLTERISGVTTRRDRLRGYEAACEILSSTPLVVWVNRGVLESFEKAVEDIQRMATDQPIAVYTANGLIMLPFYPLIRNAGMEVPDELGLATFDEPDWARLTSPPLTCIRQPTIEIGRYAGESMLKALNKGKPFSRQGLRCIPSEVVLSTSTSLSDDSP